MSEEHIIFNGMRVMPDWPAKVEEAQYITSVRIAGQNRPRVRYGDEQDDWGAGTGKPCHDCAVLKGQFHVPGCDVERCPDCGGQVICCDCDVEGL